MLKTVSCDHVILHCEQADLESLVQSKKRHKYWRKKLIIGLPPFIFEGDIAWWQERITQLTELGYTHWMLGQIGQKELVPKDSTLYADHTVWSTNNVTPQLLAAHGIDYFSYSTEDDVLNLKAIGQPNGIMTLFAYIPLFISRVRPPLAENAYLEDSRGFDFFTRKWNELYFLIGERPLCLFHRRDKMLAAGIHNFVLDLSFCQHSRKLLKTLLYHYENQEKVAETTLFNHKGGLK